MTEFMSPEFGPLGHLPDRPSRSSLASIINYGLRSGVKPHNENVSKTPVVPVGCPHPSMRSWTGRLNDLVGNKETFRPVPPLPASDVVRILATTLGGSARSPEQHHHNAHDDNGRHIPDITL